MYTYLVKRHMCASYIKLEKSAGTLVAGGAIIGALLVVKFAHIFIHMCIIRHGSIVSSFLEHENNENRHPLLAIGVCVGIAANAEWRNAAWQLVAARGVA